MAAKMKLTYFDMRGLAENIRLIMAQAGVDYEDCRIEKGQWPGMKDCKYSEVSNKHGVFLILFENIFPTTCLIRVSTLINF